MELQFLWEEQSEEEALLPPGTAQHPSLSPWDPQHEECFSSELQRDLGTYC